MIEFSNGKMEMLPAFGHTARACSKAWSSAAGLVNQTYTGSDGQEPTGPENAEVPSTSSLGQHTSQPTQAFLHEPCTNTWADDLHQKSMMPSSVAPKSEIASAVSFSHSGALGEAFVDTSDRKCLPAMCHIPKLGFCLQAQYFDHTQKLGLHVDQQPPSRASAPEGASNMHDMVSTATNSFSGQNSSYKQGLKFYLHYLCQSIAGNVSGDLTRCGPYKSSGHGISQ